VLCVVLLDFRCLFNARSQLSVSGVSDNNK